MQCGEAIKTWKEMGKNSGLFPIPSLIDNLRSYTRLASLLLSS